MPNRFTKASGVQAFESNLRELAAKYDLPSAIWDDILRAISRHLPSHLRWPFVMISPEQFMSVFRFLESRSPTPQVAVRLWGTLFLFIDGSTGEILASRKRLAEEVHSRPGEISRIMTLLESINAITRRREEGRVRYFMNAIVGTTLPGKVRSDAQQKAGPLVFNQS